MFSPFKCTYTNVEVFVLVIWEQLLQKCLQVLPLDVTGWSILAAHTTVGLNCSANSAGSGCCGLGTGDGHYREISCNEKKNQWLVDVGVRVCGRDDLQEAFDNIASFSVQRLARLQLKLLLSLLILLLRFNRPRKAKKGVRLWLAITGPVAFCDNNHNTTNLAPAVCPPMVRSAHSLDCARMFPPFVTHQASCVMHQILHYDGPW